jgi:hypothetical protein
MMSYFPAIAEPAIFNTAEAPFNPQPHFTIFTTTGPPAGRLFAAKGGNLYDVTLGGVGPWTAEVGITGTSDYWTSVMMQNIAGAFLLVTNDNGGYSYYNGTTWATPTMGVAVGEITGVDPAKFCFVMLYKKRIWFIEKNSTRAWYLPVEQVTGEATAFDFGSQFEHGGELAQLKSWSMDSGTGMEDQLVAISSQGDVAIYQGADPEDLTTFSIVGDYYVGPLPVGRRQAMSAGGDVLILSQFGLQRVSKILSSKAMAEQVTEHETFIIDPFIGRLMQTDSQLQGWQVLELAKEELWAIGVPRQATTNGGDYLAHKATNKSWSFLRDTTYTSLVNIGPQIFAGTVDGRVVKAFNGPLDNVLLDTHRGVGIKCQVLPAYNTMGNSGLYKHAMMIRPCFLSTDTPVLKVSMLVDYIPPKRASMTALPVFRSYFWDDFESLWDVARWGGEFVLFKKWIGISGVGFAMTPQLDYMCGGDTLLTNIDIWIEGGGPM